MSNNAAEKLIYFYESFSHDSVENLSGIYAQNVTFKDPIHEISGISQLVCYFQKLTRKDSPPPVFAIKKSVITADTAFLMWEMTFSHPRLNRGTALTMPGSSYIEFSNKITYQEDYYDLGAMLYEHLPIVGWVIRKIKNRLKL